MANNSEQVLLQYVINAQNQAQAVLQQNLSLLQGIVQAASGVSAATQGGAVGVRGFVATFSDLNHVLDSSVGRLTSYVTEATKVAARTQVLGTALHVAGVNAGYTTSQLNQTESTIKKLGITTQDARDIMTQFIQSQLNVADAAKLSRAAQDLAVNAGINSSQAASQLTEAIGSQSIMMLRQFGIVTHLDEIYSKYGQTINKAGSALNEQEKKQAFLNVILAQAAKVTGTYDAAMSDVGKRFTSLDRYIQETQNAIGNGLLPVFNAWVEAMTELNKWITTTSDSNRSLIASSVTFIAAFALMVGAVMKLVGAYETLRAVTLAANAASMATGVGILAAALAAAGAAWWVYSKNEQSATANKEAVTKLTERATALDALQKQMQAAIDTDQQHQLSQQQLSTFHAAFDKILGTETADWKNLKTAVDAVTGSLRAQMGLKLDKDLENINTGFFNRTGKTVDEAKARIADLTTWIADSQKRLPTLVGDEAAGMARAVEKGKVELRLLTAEMTDYTNAVTSRQAAQQKLAEDQQKENAQLRTTADLTDKLTTAMGKTPKNLKEWKSSLKQLNDERELARSLHVNENAWLEANAGRIDKLNQEHFTLTGRLDSSLSSLTAHAKGMTTAYSATQEYTNAVTALRKAISDQTKGLESSPSKWNMLTLAMKQANVGFDASAMKIPAVRSLIQDLGSRSDLTKDQLGKVVLALTRFNAEADNLDSADKLVARIDSLNKSAVNTLAGLESIPIAPGLQTTFESMQQLVSNTAHEMEVLSKSIDTVYKISGQDGLRALESQIQSLSNAVQLDANDWLRLQSILDSFGKTNIYSMLEDQQDSVMQGALQFAQGINKLGRQSADQQIRDAQMAGEAITNNTQQTLRKLDREWRSYTDNQKAMLGGTNQLLKDMAYRAGTLQRAQAVQSLAELTGFGKSISTEMERELNKLKDLTGDALVAATAKFNQWAENTEKRLVKLLKQIDQLKSVNKIFQGLSATLSGFGKTNAAEWFSTLGNAIESAGSQSLAFSMTLKQISKDGGKTVQNFADLAAAAGGMVQAMNAATSSGSRLKNALGGMITGAQMGLEIGKMFGPTGAVVGLIGGAVIGGVIGAFRKPEWKKLQNDISRDLGVAVSDATAKAMEEDSKKFGRQAATLLNINKVIEDAGGLTDKNLGMFMGKMHDIFSLIQTGQLTAAQGTKVLEENWNAFAKAGTNSVGLLNQHLVDLISLQNTFGTKSESIIAYVKQETDKAIGGMNGTVKGFASNLNTAFKGIKESYGTLVDLADQKQGILDKLKNATPNTTEWFKLQNELQKVNDQLADLSSNTDKWSRMLSAHTEDIDARTNRMGRLLDVTFQAATANGSTYLEALSAIQPSLDNLAELQKNFGLEVNDTTQHLINLGKWAKDNPDIAEGVSSLQHLLQGLANTGRVTQQTFTDLGDEAAAQFDDMVNSGMGADDAYQALGPTLQMLYELQQRFGFSVDEATQKLLDQSKQAGAVGEAQKSAAERTVDAMTRVGDILSLLAKQMGVDLPAALDVMAKSASTNAGNMAKDINAATGSLKDMKSTAADVTGAVGDALNAGSGVRISTSIQPTDFPKVVQEETAAATKAAEAQRQLDAQNTTAVLDALKQVNDSLDRMQQVILQTGSATVDAIHSEKKVDVHVDGRTFAQASINAMDYDGPLREQQLQVLGLK